MNIYTIYKATNKINNKNYIGFDSNFPSRISGHKRSYLNYDYKFYRAIRKYGWESFEWEILYQSKDRNHTLKEMEQYFITDYDSFRNGYNSTLGGEGTYGLLKSEKEKIELSKLRTELNEQSSWYNNGIENKFCITPPNETWKKGRLNQKPTTKGNKWYNNGKEQKLTNNPPKGWVLGMLPKSEETKLKISKSKLGKPSPNRGKEIVKAFKKVYTPDGVFESVKSAAKYYNISPGSMTNRIKNKPEVYHYVL